MCILLYVKLIWCSGIPQIYGQLEEGGLYVKLMQGSGIPQIYGQLDGVHLQQVYVHSVICEIIWCSGIPKIYSQLENWGRNLFGVVVIHRSMVDWRKGAVCETFAVQWYSIDLWSIGRGRPLYICILLYVKLIWCSGIPQIYGQLGVGVCLPCVYVHSAICETDLVQWCCLDLWSTRGGWAIC